jgi:hypothetical protein
MPVRYCDKMTFNSPTYGQQVNRRFQFKHDWLSIPSHLPTIFLPRDFWNPGKS